MRDWFLRADALALLPMAVLLWAVLVGCDRARGVRRARLLGVRAPFLAADLSSGRRRALRTLAVIGAAAVILAVAGPRWGDDAERFDRRGVDLVVCLDVSRSMLARDADPDRLSAARREIRAFAERTQGDRFALVVFAGEARLAVPLTHDVATFLALVDRADPLAVTRGGTDLAAALDRASVALDARGDRPGVVVLVTDGEDLGGLGQRAAQRCADAGIAVHCVGFGSARGGKIPIDVAGVGESFVVDAAGREVITAMDSASLRPIAEVTGGAFVAASARPLPLVDLYERRILPAARASRGEDPRRELANRYQWPLLLGFGLWLVVSSTTERRRVNRAGQTRRLAAPPVARVST